MDNLVFKIKVDDIVIAAFANDYDRGVAMNALQKEFSDATFTVDDDGE